jgi:hypothetical protein
MRTALRAVYWGVLGCVAAIAAVIGVVYVTHPREEAAYLSYVRTYGNYDGTHPRKASAQELISAGDRACDWLFHQTPGLWRTTAQHQLYGLSRAYARTMSTADLSLPSAVVPGAWHFLCPATADLVQGHDLLRDRNDD